MRLIKNQLPVQRLSSQAVFLMFHETPGCHENPNKTAQLRGFIVS